MAQAEPAGSVLDLPVDVWSDELGSTESRAKLMMPAALDHKGTLSLVVKVPAVSRLITLYRDTMPPELDFLFGESDRLFVRIINGSEWHAMDSLSQYVVNLTYDKSPDTPRSRKVQFLDASGKPLQGFSLRLGLKGRFKAYQTKHYEIPLDDNGMAILPPVFDPVHSKVITRTQPTEMYQVFLTEMATQQTFFGELKKYTSTPITKVIVPAPTPEDASDLVVAEGRVLNHDGTPGRATTITLLQTYRAPVREQVMSMKDPETVRLTRILPAPDGFFKIAVSPDFKVFKPGESDIPVQLREHVWALFTEQKLTLRPDRINTITLPKQLSLAAKIVDEQGEEFNAEEHLKERRKKGGAAWVCVKRIEEDCALSPCTTLYFREGYTTGSTFILRDLSVPGRFRLELNGKFYGPVDIDETSPTETIVFRPADDSGRITGTIRDEMKRPLQGALVAVVESHHVNNRLQAAGDLPALVNDLDQSTGLAKLNAITSGVIDYTFTDATGRFSFARNKYKPKHKWSAIMAAASGRYGAYFIDSTSNCNVALDEDLTLPDLHLPLKQAVTGMVMGPAQIPDPKNPGQMKSLQGEPGYYRVFHQATQNWFDQKPVGRTHWQYNDGETTAPFGQAFEYAVPVGTPFRLAAMPKVSGVSMHVWNKQALTREYAAPLALGTTHLRALRPFYIKAVYSDGTPGTGLRINAQYAPVKNGRNGVLYTGDDGMQMLYADGKNTPYIQLTSPYRRNLTEWFKPQALDTSTSIPTVTLQLDPEKWTMTGRNPMDVKE